jgi:glycosyltransferase involved in cell wall biosynthesis
MNRVLAISWSMPPLLNPRAIQVPQSLKHLAELGWEITVITSDHNPPWKAMSYDLDLEKRFQDTGFRTVSVKHWERYLAVRAIWSYVPWLRPLPDDHRPWSKKAAHVALEECAAHHYDVILSFGVPWSDHLIGLEVHRRTQIPWVAHFSDPWTDSPYFSANEHSRRICMEMEADVVREANRLIFVTQQVSDMVMRKYPDAWKEKAQVITNSYAPEQNNSPVAPSPRHKKLRMVYTGTFYGIRTPIPLFRALQRLQEKRPLDQQLEIHMIGSVPAKYGYQQAVLDYGLERIVSFKGLMSYGASKVAKVEADVLLVIDAPSQEDSMFLPSKLIEYLPLQKPLLGLTPLKGAAADLLRRLDARVVPPDDVEAIERAVGDVLDEWQSGKLPLSPHHAQIMEAFDVRNTAKQLADVLQNVQLS